MFVLIDFEGFIQLTEELGGVKVYNKYASVSWGYSFPVGNVNLRGEQALAYVRERRQLSHGDLDRGERQRVVLRAIFAKGLAKETLTNPFKLVNFVRGVTQHVSVDDGLTRGSCERWRSRCGSAPTTIPGHPSTWDIAEALNRWPLAVRLGPCVGSGECCPWQSLPFSLQSTPLS